MSCGPYGCTPSSDVYNKQNACRTLAIVSVPLALMGVPEAQLSARAARVISWLGVGGAVAGLGCMD